MIPRKLDHKILNKAGLIPSQTHMDQWLCKVREPVSKNSFQFLNYLNQIHNKGVRFEYLASKVFSGELNSTNKESERLMSKLDQQVKEKLDQVLQEAFENGYSDVHFEPYRNHLEIYIRYGSNLKMRHKLPRPMQERLINMIKVMAKLDTEESQRPQNGKFTHAVNKVHVECRISILPCLHGESIVLRMHHQKDGEVFFGDDLMETQFARDVVDGKPGLWLITGSIGNGKTTTYYRLLNKLIKHRILSLEDPIEIPQPRLVQMRLKEEIVFSELIRNLLRQSINVIGIGEIRTLWQLKLAANSAVTGHCTVSTFHGNSLEEVKDRLKELGYHLEGSVSFIRGILHQSWESREHRKMKFQEKFFDFNPSKLSLWI